jgi:regulatory protein
MTDSIQRAQIYAQRLIQYRPRSENELKSRLAEKGFTEDLIDRIVSSFKNQGLLDDRRFARLWVRMRSQQAMRSTTFIKRELFLKGVDKEIIESAIDEAKKDFNEEGMARELFQKRLRLLQNLPQHKARQRLYGYLKRRGFSTGTIMRLLHPSGARNDEY